jgi:hypothetical protein
MSLRSAGALRRHVVVPRPKLWSVIFSLILHVIKQVTVMATVDSGMVVFPPDAVVGLVFGFVDGDMRLVAVGGGIRAKITVWIRNDNNLVSLLGHRIFTAYQIKWTT